LVSHLALFSDMERARFSPAAATLPQRLSELCGPLSNEILASAFGVVSAPAEGGATYEGGNLLSLPLTRLPSLVPPYSTRRPLWKGKGRLQLRTSHPPLGQRWTRLCLLLAMIGEKGNWWRWAGLRGRAPRRRKSRKKGLRGRRNANGIAATTSTPR